MQFQPPSQPGWGQSEPGQQTFPEWQQQPSMYVPTPPGQQTGYPQWPQQPAYPPQQPMYPPQPQQWPPMQPLPPQKPRSAFKLGLGVGCGFIAAIALAIIVIVVLASAGSHNTYSPTSSTVSQTTPATSLSTPGSNQLTSAPQPTTFKVGETATDGTTWNVTVNSVKMATSGAYASAANGNIYLTVDVTMENISSTPQFVSSEGSFTLKDTTGQVYTEAVNGIGVPPNGTIQPGTKLRGQISYEIPKSLHDFTFQFQGNVFNGSAAIWVLSV